MEKEDFYDHLKWISVICRRINGYGNENEQFPLLILSFFQPISFFPNKVELPDELTINELRSGIPYAMILNIVGSLNPKSMESEEIFEEIFKNLNEKYNRDVKDLSISDLIDGNEEEHLKLCKIIEEIIIERVLTIDLITKRLKRLPRSFFILEKVPEKLDEACSLWLSKFPVSDALPEIQGDLETNVLSGQYVASALSKVFPNDISMVDIKYGPSLSNSMANHNWELIAPLAKRINLFLPERKKMDPRLLYAFIADVIYATITDTNKYIPQIEPLKVERQSNIEITTECSNKNSQRSLIKPEPSFRTIEKEDDDYNDSSEESEYSDFSSNSFIQLPIIKQKKPKKKNKTHAPLVQIIYKSNNKNEQPKQETPLQSPLSTQTLQQPNQSMQPNPMQYTTTMNPNQTMQPNQMQYSQYMQPNQMQYTYPMNPNQSMQFSQSMQPNQMQYPPLIHPSQIQMLQPTIPVDDFDFKGDESLRKFNEEAAKFSLEAEKMAQKVALLKCAQYADNIAKSMSAEVLPPEAVYEEGGALNEKGSAAPINTPYEDPDILPFINEIEKDADDIDEYDLNAMLNAMQDFAYLPEYEKDEKHLRKLVFDQFDENFDESHINGIIKRLIHIINKVSEENSLPKVMFSVASVLFAKKKEKENRKENCNFEKLSSFDINAREMETKKIQFNETQNIDTQTKRDFDLSNINEVFTKTAQIKPEEELNEEESVIEAIIEPEEDIIEEKEITKEEEEAVEEKESEVEEEINEIKEIKLERKKKSNELFKNMEETLQTTIENFDTMQDIINSKLFANSEMITKKRRLYQDLCAFKGGQVVFLLNTSNKDYKGAYAFYSDSEAKRISGRGPIFLSARDIGTFLEFDKENSTFNVLPRKSHSNVCAICLKRSLEPQCW